MLSTRRSDGEAPSSPTTKSCSSRLAEWSSGCGQRSAATARQGSNWRTTSDRPRRLMPCSPDAARAGATIARPATRADWGGYTGAFADPDGYLWEVAHNPGWTLADDGSVRLA